VYEDAADSEPFSMADREELSETQQRLQLVSLRDQDNLPHATAWMMPGQYVYSCLGRGTGRAGVGSQPELQGQKLQRVLDWCERDQLAWRGKSIGAGALVIRAAEQAEGGPLVICEADGQDLTPAPGHARRPDPHADMQRRIGGLIAQLVAIEHGEQGTGAAGELQQLIAQADALFTQFDVHGLSDELDRNVRVLEDAALALCERLYERDQAPTPEAALEAVARGLELMGAANG
jgi:hypothetical protein